MISKILMLLPRCTLIWSVASYFQVKKQKYSDFTPHDTFIHCFLAEHNVLRVELSTKSPQNFLLRQFASLVGGDFVHSYLSVPLVNITYKQDHNALNLSTPPSSSWQYLFPRETLNAESITRWYHIIPKAYRQVYGIVFDPQ